MVIKKGKTETEKTIEEMKLPKWLDDLITKKWFLYLATTVMIVLLIGSCLPATTKDNVANAIFAKTATDVSAAGGPPNGGAKNPPIIGAATPTPTEGTEGKEKTRAYVPKYYPNGPANLGNDIQEIALNNLPEKLLIARGGIVYMKDLRVEGNYLYGDLMSTVDITSEDVRIVFLDKNGNPTADHLVNSLSFGRYNEQTKQNEFAEPDKLSGKLSGSGIRDLKKGIELPFRVPIPKGAVYIQTIRM